MFFFFFLSFFFSFDVLSDTAYLQHMYVVVLYGPLQNQNYLLLVCQETIMHRGWSGPFFNINEKGLIEPFDNRKGIVAVGSCVKVWPQLTFKDTHTPDDFDFYEYDVTLTKHFSKFCSRRFCLLFSAL